MKKLYLTLMIIFSAGFSFAVAPVTGTPSFCKGSNAIYADATPGGIWTSENTAIAIVGSSSGMATGISTGTTHLTYTMGAAYSTYLIEVLAIPSVIGGPSAVCIGYPVTETDSITGGVWTTPSLSVTIGMTSGVLTGITSGTAVISYTNTSGCAVSRVITVNAAPVSYHITGGGTYCIGGAGYHIGIDGSGTGVNYQLFMSGVAIGSPVAGTGTALDFGVFTTAGIYTVLGTNATTTCNIEMTGSDTISINPAPTVYTVTGGGTYCTGGAGVHIFLSNSDMGINYQMYLGTTLVSLLAGTGLPLDFGLFTSVGYYTIRATNATTGCNSIMAGSATVTIDTIVTPSVTINITPGDTVCPGTLVTFSETNTGGGSAPTFIWRVNSVIVATGPTFTYVPVAGDMIGVNMNSSATCAIPASVSFDTFIVVRTPAVTGTMTTAACGSIYTLSASGATNYIWSPSTGLSCATCATTTINPSATINYVVTGSVTGGCSGTYSVTVPGNRIHGNITFSSAAPDTLDTKVWLIQFNSVDSSIAALDSTTTCLNGGVPYYEFDGVASGNYLVKAKLIHAGAVGCSGYIPTYGASSSYWYSGTTVMHTTSSDSQDINMIYGTVPAGTGFISGYVISGAGRGTSTDVPVAGMIIYLRNAANNILTYTFTDATGNYFFNNLDYGTYNIYPENYSYYTIPSAEIILTSTGGGSNDVNFKRHTTSRIISLIRTNGVDKVSKSLSSYKIYPNPVNDMLTIQWHNQIGDPLNVVITDVLGRQVFNTQYQMIGDTGEKQVDLSGFKSGVYCVTFRSGSEIYTVKLVKQD